MGHTVLAPDASEHIASPNDPALLLADLVRAVRLGDRVRLLEPLAQPWGCAACMAAYSQARDALVAAGGVTEWLAQFEARATG
jgi:hypothetical protein